ncbi:survival motor neuron-like protein 1 [Colletotrichum kahawae]|uniref:Survival motor neuron-like protein 1 n=1 Tax=Colletotrichum kahawae TaxID=34407 RepID=A0AAD9YVC4_COLKA|nr:survival motor neuron-like protein 1 [Colletotrichum kahawae]
MPSNDMDMTHAEIWDDSALIDSWNEALNEYKVRPFRPGQENLPTSRTGDSETKAVDQPEIVDDGEVAHETKGAGGSTDVKQPIHPRGNPGRSEKLGIHPSCILVQSKVGAPIAKPISGSSGSVPSPATMGPQALLGSVQDEGLKRLLMSWYYAGYYTGLYEGQQQQQQQTQEPRQ